MYGTYEWSDWILKFCKQARELLASVNCRT